MLGAIRDIGFRFGEIKLYDDVKADKVLVLNFDERGNFKGVELEKFSKDKLNKYLYKKAKGSNPPTLTPTLILNREKRKPTDKKSPIMKTLENLEKALKSCSVAEKDIPNLNLEKERTEESIEEATKDIPNKEKVLLTIKVDGKYIGELEGFKRAVEKLSAQEGKDSKGKAVCSVCLEEGEVSGDISPYKFYTIDKPGYISGGFDKKEAYRNFPLCYECKRYIEEGKRLIDNKLKFNLSGLRYQLIPELMTDKEEVVLEVVESLFNNDVRKIKLSNREKRPLLSGEDDILELLSEERDVLSVNLLFLESQQGAERILLHLQDIYPSRLRQLFDAKGKVEKFLGLENFTYETVYRFFSKSDPSKRNPDLQKYFLEVVDKTFRSIRIDAKFLIRFLLGRIRDAVKKSEEGYPWVIRDAFGVFLFVKLTTGEVVMERMDFENLEEFLKSLPAVDTDLKKGLFLMGALTERLLRVQRNERGSKPFLKKLKALKMNETDLKGLLPEIRMKLEEYDRYRAGEDRLFKLASQYLSEAPSKWNMSIDEMNFYFALGMGMFDKLAEFIYRKEDGDEEQA
ncbi:TIGR02556 family CRISPR-associated protein [Hydrogenivirga sp. 128-5-R1-1]|uniref:TIGR02556 family CRISPR-associated protein n=1 Tax=Hydrogenivirga sp. 128-5-R1-1 TaxID=392423 RepID=UPI00015F180D|nr:TIGR02556 family CRISPR-associated protein [Hydrogenivirga sp. 128-5-R1-1]EDP75367.1 hypothetical protein HG1285_15421 [Hydrogenivirga sp. 128-5-R1-1]